MTQFEVEILALPHRLSQAKPELLEDSVRPITKAKIRTREQLIATLAIRNINTELATSICWVMPRLKNQRGFRSALLNAALNKRPRVRA